MPDFKHGAAYSNHGCRCDVCRKWQSEKSRKYRERNRELIRQRRAANSEKNAENTRRWRASNPERARENRDRWNANNPEKIYAIRKRSRQRNADQRRAYNLQWYDRNRERSRAVRHEYYKNNSEHICNRTNKYSRRNRRYCSESKRQWYAKRRDQIPSTRNYSPWQSWEDAIVLRDDISMTEIACMLQRSYTAVKSRRSVLRNPKKASGGVMGFKMELAQ